VIALVDYGAGNQTSVRKALLAVGAEVFTPSAPPALQFATAIVIPGVGHFAATASLDARWRSAIADAIDAGIPLLGICLGMQWLFEGSDEEPGLPGLGYCPGRVTRLMSRSWGPASAGPGVRPDCERIKIPHVGWNVVEWPERPAEAGRHDESRIVGSGFSRTPPPAFEALHGHYAYFTHTFAAPVTDDCAGITTHGGPFAAAVARGNVWGVQFHPEKSGQTGLALLRAFVELAQEGGT
jgi:glutamine amidotransferase